MREKQELCSFCARESRAGKTANRNSEEPRLPLAAFLFWTTRWLSLHLRLLVVLPALKIGRVEIIFATSLQEPGADQRTHLFTFFDEGKPSCSATVFSSVLLKCSKFRTYHSFRGSPVLPQSCKRMERLNTNSIHCANKRKRFTMVGTRGSSGTVSR